ncbi:MAG: dipeptide ABC transporter ATP-binding protein [Desulfobacteraceae bacterium]|nr:MAG: dipeptide ABC transporter ATP-binding protein [Desulfobacteraceae bacterium]
MHDSQLLEVRQLKKYFPVARGLFHRTRSYVKAVDGVDLTIRRGETMGLVGESGCGKSTLGYCILRLEEPTSGQVLFEGQDILSRSKKDMQALRRNMQIIFQDPYASLNPRKTVRQTIGEAFQIHGLLKTGQRQERMRELMEVVGLQPEHLYRYPHEFSGGQRQRISISRALALNPKLVIADEPVSALDVSIQAQILNLLVSLQEKYHLTYLFISHDLGVVRHLCDRISVMYLGRIVELSASPILYVQPGHPYTASLISAVPVANPFRKRHRMHLPGDVPSPIDTPAGCSFHPRCPNREKICSMESPMLGQIETGHWVACHFPIEGESTIRSSSD